MNPFHGILALFGLGVFAGCNPEIQSAGLDPSSAAGAISGLRIAPTSVQLAPGETAQFSASTVNGRGESQPTSLATFSTTGGTIDRSGLYLAPQAGDYQVTARYKKGSTILTASAQVAVRDIVLPPPPPPPPSGPLGLNADLYPLRLFPADNPWNQPVDTAQVDPNSDAIVGLIGATKAFHPDFGANWNGGPFGIPYVVVSGSQTRVAVTFDYSSESDPGPYPIPPNPPIEGGASSTGDRHVLVVDRDAWKLYELFSAYPQAGGT